MNESADHETELSVESGPPDQQPERQADSRSGQLSADSAADNGADQVQDGRDSSSGFKGLHPARPSVGDGKEPEGPARSQKAGNSADNSAEDGVVSAKSGPKRDGGEGSSGAPAQAPIPPAPEEYNIDYRQPGGIDPYIDSQFRSFAHQNGVSGELAQKMVDFNSSLEAARWQDHQQQVEQWERETRSLPGWHGRNYTRNIGIARRAMQTFGSPELAELVGSSGYGNHPEVVKAFYNVGKCLSEDSYVDSNRRTPRKKTIGEILYPNQPV